MIFVLSIFVIVCFVVGVALLFRGYTNLPSAEKIASRADLEKADQGLKLARDEAGTLRLQLDELVVQLEETKGKLAWAEKNVQASENFRAQGAQAQARIDQLEKDLNFLSQKADSQAREAIDVITRLAAERENLQRSLGQASGAVNSEEFQQLKDENQKFKIQVEGYANKVKELEALAGSQGQANDKIAQLETENKTLREQPAGPAADPAAEEELKKVRQQSEERLVQANASLAKLYSEMEALNSRIGEKDSRIKQLNEELLISRRETAGASSGQAAPAQEWVQEKADLEKCLQELQKANQYLVDKEKVLTFKLAQSRAQALGLEKICEEFKYQVERK